MKTTKASKSKAPKITATQSERGTASTISPPGVSKSARSSAPQSVPVITSEDIARRAYAIWEKQGRPAGKEKENWLQAELQLKTSQSFSE